MTHAGIIASYPGPNSIQALATDPSGNIFVEGTTGSLAFPVLNAEQPAMGDVRVMTSVDGGATWTKAGNPPGDAEYIATSPLAPQTLLASTSLGIYKSTDGGATWRSVYAPAMSPCGGLGVVVDPANPLHAAAWGFDPSSSYVVLIRSVDGGETWTENGLIKRECFTPGVPGVWVDPSGSGALFVEDVDWSFFVSRDWGLTFRTVSPDHSAVTSVVFNPSRPGSLYVTTYQTGVIVGNYFFSSDFGMTWTVQPTPRPYTVCGISGTIVDPDQPNTIVLAQCDVVYVSFDSGASWTAASTTDVFYQSYSSLMLSRQCPGGGSVIGFGTVQPPFVPAPAGSSADFGLNFSTIQLGDVLSIASAGCTLYATRGLTTDAFIAKLTPDGQTLWATYLGGSDADSAVALAVDTQGNSYVSGNTVSPDFPSTAPALSPIGTGSAFVTKFSADGALLYSVVIGSGTAGAIAVDGEGSAYLLGTTGSQQFPATPGALVATMDSQAYTGFLVKLSPHGALNYATYLGSAYTYASGIVVDGQNQPILVGAGSVPGSPPSPLNSPTPGYVAQLDAGATQVLKSVQFPNSLGAIAMDSNGDLFVGGPAPTVDDLICGASSLAKLAGADWHAIYSLAHWGPCVVALTLKVDGSGALYVAADDWYDWGPWPLTRATLERPVCIHYNGVPYSENGFGGSALAKLSPSGSAVEHISMGAACPPLQWGTMARST